ncbi:type I-C CRISPR-associated protein Cas8c/Csd1 [Neisseria flavescens]|uniref:type I-C CRISPR-associated protein Cas8c/Csd1 n=1 Tax=Neisseria flavescens TaxID=484 RepID=UPI000AC518F4|nr:type I-C CRISPR-associated protein Cas8c/Csd1 [Neisseria flavescens]
MILHALTQYYQRKAESDGGVAPEGFENKEIPFIIVIDKQGKFIQLEDTRELKGKKKVGRIFLVPKGLGRSGSKSYEVSNLLWDHYGYVLAYAGEKGQEQADKQHASFTANVNELKQALPDNAGVAAIAAFLASAEEKAKSCRPKIGRNVPKSKAVISASAWWTRQ